MRDGPLNGSNETLPALRRELLQPPDLARLEPVVRVGAEGPTARKRTVATFTQCHGAG